jgi:hypothetical protein
MEKDAEFFETVNREMVELLDLARGLRNEKMPVVIF